MPEHGVPVEMARVAIVARESRVRESLVGLAEAGVVEFVGELPAAEGEEVEALRDVERRGPTGLPPTARIARAKPDLDDLERTGARDLIAGEIELKRRADAAVQHGRFSAFVGWTPRDAVDGLAKRLASVGAAVVELPRPAWTEPPTLLRPVRPAKPFRLLVDTYGTPRYANVDPTPFAAFSFVLMFGIMFGDAGHGLMLVLLGLLLRRRARSTRLSALRPLWPLLASAGGAAILFGFLYGEFFGPTGLLPTLWLHPLDEPVRFLAIAAGIGAVLLAGSFGLGIVNRWREGGPRTAVVAPSGVAGLGLFVGGGIALAGVYWDAAAAFVVGVGLAGSSVVLLAIGFVSETGMSATGVAQAAVEVFDSVVRTLANAISFTRLAAFGLMHAAISLVVLDAAQALWGGAVGSLFAAIVFVVGNAAAFALETLVAGVQALRLEYYELFSRVFAGEGHKFSPWKVPLMSIEEAT